MRRETKQISVRGVLIGGGAPVTVQSMTVSKTKDVLGVSREIADLYDAGCDIVRVSVPDMESAEAIPKIRELFNGRNVPLVADIHFDYKLALAAIRNRADKIRINPGNIGSPEKVREITSCAHDYHIPIRVGVNSGSLEPKLLSKYGGPTAEALAESALNNSGLLESFGFYDICISAKSSDPTVTLEANRILSQKTDYPLHIGVTEAGTEFLGAVRSAACIGALLSEGIGDTIRFSLTGSPLREAEAGIELLRSLGLRKPGARLISCPMCARTAWDMLPVANEMENWLKSVNLEITVAVMGCAVNGPGEASRADFGIAGGSGEGIIFKHGEILRKAPETELAGALKALIREEYSV